MANCLNNPSTTSGTTKILYWNIHGLTENKIKELYTYFADFNAIIIAETFTEKKNFSKLQISFTINYNWRWTTANRVLARGRASAGLVMGLRKNHKWSTFWSYQKHSINRAVDDGVDINIIGVYCHTGVNEVKKIVEPHMEEP